MSKITEIIWPIEPHTEAKLAILRKYLDAWLPIITRWNGRVLYIDGFAGPGEYIGTDGLPKKGSPLIAIKAFLEQKIEIRSEIKMLFIEAEPKRCEHLTQKVKSLSLPANIKTETICARFDETITQILNYLDEQKKRLAPAFVFIDPFGFTGIPFSLIKRVMGYKKCEILITFMYEEINRFVSEEILWPRLEETFGTDRWKAVINEKEPVNRVKLLRSIYQEQLEQQAGIKYVQSFKMLNKTNKTDYFLFFGTNDLTGLKKMKEAMWKVDRSGLFQFSDATYNSSQPMLIEAEPDYAALKKMITTEFKGQSVTVPKLEYFILTHTPFRETHYKKQILKPMEDADPPEIEVNCPGTRRRGTFPETCIIKFM